MDLITTLALAGAAVALAIFAGWRGARPWDFRGVRMIPWRLIMVLSSVAVLILLIHAGTLLGVPQRPW